MELSSSELNVGLPNDFRCWSLALTEQGYTLILLAGHNALQRWLAIEFYSGKVTIACDEKALWTCFLDIRGVSAHEYIHVYDVCVGLTVRLLNPAIYCLPPLLLCLWDYPGIPPLVCLLIWTEYNKTWCRVDGDESDFFPNTFWGSARWILGG